MHASILPLIYSFLPLSPVASSLVPPSLDTMPPEMQLAILKRLDFCDYVTCLASSQWASAHTDVGQTLLKKVAEEEKSLWLVGTKRVRKQQILKSIRTFVRITSRLPIICNEMDAEKLKRLANLFESHYEFYSSFSESPTWKKACLAGLFGGNTLVILLPYLSNEFRSDTRDMLLQTAFFSGDIDSLKEIAKFFRLSKKSVLAKVSEVDIVFSGSVPFLEELLNYLPTLRLKRLSLIKESIMLQRQRIFAHVLPMAKPVQHQELNQMIVSLSQHELFKDSHGGYFARQHLFSHLLLEAAKHGHVSIIRFLGPAMDEILVEPKVVIAHMMATAGRYNHCNVLEFLLGHDGAPFMQIAHKYVNRAFKAAFKKGNVTAMKFLRGKDKDGNLIAPRLGLTRLREKTLSRAIKTNKNWDGIRYLVFLKTRDSRFANFEVVGPNNAALGIACKIGDYKLVQYLLEKNAQGEYRFPLTNPGVDDNDPLITACMHGHSKIVTKLLERDESGNYIHKNIDPSARDHQSIAYACGGGHWEVVEFLLQIHDGKYVLPKIEGVDLTCALGCATRGDRIRTVRFLLRKASDGSYLLPGMSVRDYMLRWLDPNSESTKLLQMHLGMRHISE